MTLQIPSLILFDMDDTLTDNTDVLPTMIAQTFNALSRPVPDGLNDAMKDIDAKGKPIALKHNRFMVHYLLYDSKGDPDRSIRNAYLHEYGQNFPFHVIKPEATAIETLEKIKKIEIPMGVVTNTESSPGLSILEQTGLKNYFDVLTFRDDVPEGHGKPNPDLLIEAVKRANKTHSINPQKQQIWMVGDNDSDMGACGNLMENNDWDPIEQRNWNISHRLWS